MYYFLLNYCYLIMKKNVKSHLGSCFLAVYSTYTVVSLKSCFTTVLDNLFIYFKKVLQSLEERNKKTMREVSILL